MSLFNPYITKISQYSVELRRKGGKLREIGCPESVDDLLSGLPVRVGPKAGEDLILRGDTFVELGNPEVGSVSFLLWTDDPSLVKSGRVTLAGPDIPESKGASLPFGQVIIVAGKKLGGDKHEVLEGTQYVSDQIEGYMLKSMSRHAWSRISNDVAAKGFSFETLGRALMAVFKSSIPEVEAVEILFVTTSKEDLQPLEDLSEQVREISKNVTKDVWKSKGYDIECFSTFDCDACPDRTVCDDIKDIVNVRKVTKKSNGGSESED
ncbi:MAG: carbon monoxide dehydrogenase [Dehalococcoidia bacterium]|jgi:CO dehydrogenase/acetyl-CoA synthase beta subunit